MALSSAAFAITNADDKRGEVMLQNTACSKIFLQPENNG